jgi:crotonobetainyl-CoA:carnitine CoA-transferase CaiB-like acyl-CoA transferase
MPRHYTPAEIDKALSAYVLTGGNAKQAQELLLSYDGKAPSDVTIGQWAKEHADRYHELREELAPQVAKKIAAEAEGLALKLAQAEEKLTAKLLEAIENGELPAKEYSGALRNITTSKALQVDKLSSPLRGRPTVIHGPADPSEMLATLARKLGIPDRPEIPQSSASSP